MYFQYVGIRRKKICSQKSLQSYIHHVLLLDAYITPPAHYGALTEKQCKLVTTYCHSRWRTDSNTQRAGDQAAIMMFRKQCHSDNASLTHKSRNFSTLSLLPHQAGLQPSFPFHTHTQKCEGPSVLNVLAVALQALEKCCSEWCCTAVHLMGDDACHWLSHTEKTWGNLRAKKETVCFLKCWNAHKTLTVITNYTKDSFSLMSIHSTVSEAALPWFSLSSDSIKIAPA